MPEMSFAHSSPFNHHRSSNQQIINSYILKVIIIIAHHCTPVVSAMVIALGNRFPGFSTLLHPLGLGPQTACLVTSLPDPTGHDEHSFFMLVHEAEENATARPLIAQLMVSKFRVPEKLIRLECTQRLPAITEDAITIIEVPTIRLFLKHFGGLVRKLRFSAIHGCHIGAHRAQFGGQSAD